MEERTFRYYVGVADASGNPNFKTVIVSSQHTLTIDRPSVSLGVSFNGETGDTYIASAGRDISANISYKNNLSDKLVNPRIVAKITGQALDRQSIIAMSNGFYDSSSNSITWSLGSNGVQELSPGDGGNVSFRFASILNPSSTQSGREVNLQVSLVGTPLSNPSQTVTVTESRVIKISSEVSLSSETLYSKGLFTNHGPVPPKAESETSYTVIWRAVNTQAQIDSTFVTAKLGQGVTWLGSSGDNVTYDSSSNTVTWDIGTLASGAGSSLPEATASFQIAITPSLSQVGIAPTLVSDIHLGGIDSITGQDVSVYNQALTTRISGDPIFVQGDEYVVK
jgi:hypothetical protein